MDFDKLNRWLTLVTNVGLITGLILVAMQINQSRHLVRGELGTQQRDYYSSIFSAVSGEDIRNVIAIALQDPMSLSQADAIVLNSYMHNVTGHVHRERYLKELGIFEEDPADFERWVVRQFFGNNYSRIWWEENKDDFPTDSVRVMEDEMTAISIDRDRQYLDKYRRPPGGE